MRSEGLCDRCHTSAIVCSLICSPATRVARLGEMAAPRTGHECPWSARLQAPAIRAADIHVREVQRFSPKVPLKIRSIVVYTSILCAPNGEAMGSVGRAWT